MMEERPALELALSRTDSFIESADAKAGVVAALLAGFTAVLVTSDHFLACAGDALSSPVENATAVLALAIAAGAAVTAGVSVFAALFPRTRARGGTSSLYFGEIARHKDASSLIREIESEGFDLNRELANQVLACSSICVAKMRWVKVSSVAAAVSIAAIAAFSLLMSIG